MGRPEFPTTGFTREAGSRWTSVDDARAEQPALLREPAAAHPAALRAIDGIAVTGFERAPGGLDRFVNEFVVIPLTQTDEQKRNWESVLAPPFNRINEYGSPDFIDTKLNELEADLTARRDRYHRQMTEATNPRMQAYYRELFIAMALDVGDIAEAKKSPDSKVRGEAYNRIAFEAHIEVKYNVVLVNGGGKPWKEGELEGIKNALALLPFNQTVHSEDLFVISKTQASVVNGVRAHGVHHADGTIEVTDASLEEGGMVGVRDTMLHEVGHGETPTGALFDEFKAISGWKSIGRQDDPRLAEFSKGDFITAGELRRRGFEVDGPDDQHFQLSKSQGQIFIVPSPPPPHPSDKFVSDYARTDPLEDFAETFTFYHLHPDEMRTRFPQKFEFMEKHFGRKG